MALYRFTQTVFQAGGETSEGTLMKPSDSGVRAKPQIRQYSQRHGFEDVEFSDPADFCRYLEEVYYKDTRKVFYMERADSKRYLVYSTSPYDDKDKELFTLGEFEEVA